MRLDVALDDTRDLDAYGNVPIAFEVASVLDVADDGSFSERLVVPWTKDYDSHEPPASWRRFDLSRWGVLVARGDGRRVGGAVIAFDTPGVDMLEGRRDLAVVWDLRVAPEARGHGVGRALFEAAERWAREHGARELRVETQNVNTAACRFYAARGCAPRSIRRGAYPELPDEVQIIFGKAL